MTARALFHRFAPLSLLAARDRAHSQRRLADWGCPEVNRKLFSRLGRKVVAGPFEGVTLTSLTEREQAGPYLLGAYESELFPAWEQVLSGEFDQILDVGAKFGFYAIALARAFPRAEVVAFDPDPWAKRATREMVRGNGVTNVRIAAACSPAWLRENLRPRSFIISDCEGYEDVLFADPPPSIRTATLIVETHETLVAGVEARLSGIFSSSHDVEVIRNRSEPSETAVSLDFLAPNEVVLALHEIRPPQAWLFCTPRRAT